MTEFVIARFELTLDHRMLNSRAYDMAGAQSRLLAP